MSDTTHDPATQDIAIQDTDPAHQRLRADVRDLCRGFRDEYWRDRDRERAYPEEFVSALTRAGYLSVLIPAQYGGLGMGVTEGGIILQEINRSGGHSAACHAQMYTMAPLLRHGTEAQRRRYLPEIATGGLRLQAFSITEPEAGSNTTRIRTAAVRDGDDYVVTGHKNWTSRITQSDLLMLLARTRPLPDDPAERAEGISLFLIDLRRIRAEQPGTLVVEPVRTMFNYATNQVWYKDMRIPADSLIGEEGSGFRYVIDGWNAERILLASEAVGDGYWFLDRAIGYVRERDVFGHPVGADQGVQFPLARAYTQVVAADQMRTRAAALFDSGRRCGAEANTAKFLASEASWQAANICLDAHGGNGFVDTWDVERKFRETRMYQVAPVNNNLILAFLGQHVLGLPRSY
ncbi:acyl-CoA dehydrogenase family protein [Planotetraspora kaengkrachanensis]|uniref:Acyl-CoA dehydrogenase n=1 Tax=Planotetraspora kaengkrachanensis TaxID=575193 RepID=A0A8J3V913_9ACTN|nr:acyl-CoA dehydrogenase family protein [Planotetraspora kaengkrachanensis]GIG83080.1 acyl-CoA dehydrogenase [Planotetraspora kaengkrachanensis]